jgi:tetratricopeptide (TPR) repeat protein
MTGTSPAAAKGDVRQAFANAQRWVNAGRPDLATEQLEAILQAVPGEVNSLCLLGSLYSSQGRLEEALVLLARACDAAPGFHQAALELARVQRQVGQIDAALSTLEGLTARAPDHSRAWNVLGDALCEAKRFEDGRRAFRKAAETDPHRGLIARSIKALNENRRAEAERDLREVVKADPDHVHALVGLASLALDAGVTVDAERLLERARRLSPYSDVVWRNIARLESERADYAKAEAAARLAVEVAPDRADSWSMLGNVQAWGLKPDDARDSFRQCLAVDADQPRVWLSLGHALKTLGDRAECEAAYGEAIRLDPALGEAYWSLADLKTYRFDDAQRQTMTAALKDEAVPPGDRAGFHFALGKAFEDDGAFEDSFDHYAQGNAIKARLDTFDMDGFQATCAKLKAAFPVLSERSTNAEGPTPIFIVGLPRAGSTLLEQILASHSAVEGTMELPHMLTYVRDMIAGPGYPEALDAMDAGAFAALGARYLEETAVYHGDAPFFIDKMPNNFVQVGLITRALPNAIIIDARRDPRDCGLSCFKQNFARGQTFTYDLETLGRYYRAYVDLMAHWDAAGPGRVIRVRYEDVVADLNSEVRRVLAQCGLEFEEACLRFHETRRAVRTASAEQVRQPIYAKGVGHWRKYEHRLEPLVRALGDVLATEGRANG